MLLRFNQERNVPSTGHLYTVTIQSLCPPCAFCSPFTLTGLVFQFHPNFTKVTYLSAKNIPMPHI